jgi:PEP-CTERM motif
MKKMIVLMSLLLMFCLPVLGSAHVIDFETLTLNSTYNVNPGIVYPDVTFTYIGADGYFRVSASPGAPLSGNTILGPDAHVQGEMYKAIFSIGGVNTVSVDMGDYDSDADPLVLYAYNSSNVLIGSDSALLDASVNGGLTLSVSTSQDIAYVLFNNAYGEFPGSVFIDNFTYNSTTVPEPATMLLFGLGLIGVAGVRRKFKK